MYMHVYMLCCCCCLVTKSYPTRCDPMDCGPLGFPIHGILHARILEWVAISFSKKGLFLTQELNPGVLPWQADSLVLSHQGSYVCVLDPSISLNNINWTDIILINDFLPKNMIKRPMGINELAVESD